MYCPSCGKAIANESAFCMHCGNRILQYSGLSSESASTQRKEATTEEKRYGPIYAVKERYAGPVHTNIGRFIVLVIIMVVVIWSNSRQITSYISTSIGSFGQVSAIDVQLSTANAAFLQGNWTEAIPLYQSYLSENNMNAEAHFRLGKALLNVSNPDYTSAVNELRIAIQQDSNAYFVSEAQTLIQHYRSLSIETTVDGMTVIVDLPDEPATSQIEPTVGANPGATSKFADLHSAIIGKWEIISDQALILFGSGDIIEFYRNGSMSIGQYGTTFGWPDDNHLQIGTSPGIAGFIGEVTLSDDTLTLTPNNGDSIVLKRYSVEPVSPEMLVGEWKREWIIDKSDCFNGLNLGGSPDVMSFDSNGKFQITDLGSGQLWEDNVVNGMYNLQGEHINILVSGTWRGLLPGVKFGPCCEEHEASGEMTCKVALTNVYLVFSNDAGQTTPYTRMDK